MATVSPIEDGNAAESITTVVRAYIKAGKEQEYERWLHGINEDCTRFAGFQGATILRPNDKSHRHRHRAMLQHSLEVLQVSSTTSRLKLRSLSLTRSFSSYTRSCFEKLDALVRSRLRFR